MLVMLGICLGLSDGQVGCLPEFSVAGHVQSLPWVSVLVW